MRMHGYNFVILINIIIEMLSRGPGDIIQKPLSAPDLD